jgi:hypothetical protein
MAVDRERQKISEADKDYLTINRKKSHETAAGQT